ncbi:MAG: hydantoinase/oxoprolinase family protein [Deltaproteobacteria bacterium]|nr:hydantoinase/oxoprolinase family protein [Deltaproteobacteria bacterium]
MGDTLIGIDVGGTFTDLVIFDRDRQAISTVKVSSTPREPSRGVVAGLRRVLESGAPSGSIRYLAHGTTVATNTLIESKGARTGLLTTRGFNAILPVGTQARPPGPSARDIYYQKPALLVPLSLVREIPERTGSRGEILEPLDVAETRRAIESLKAERVQAIAICFLFSFMNPAHEQAAGGLIQEIFPECFRSLSADLLPQIREYPRFSTTVINAYVGPLLSSYLTRLEGAVRELDIETRHLYLMLSHGGLVPFASGASQPCQTILSGPAAGVQAGAFFGRVAPGAPHVITMDMGGTSCDIGVCKLGIPGQTTKGEVEGRPLAVPMVDVQAIGAGGGTQARVEDGRLRVGPRSSGADPGPACYGAGGTIPTVTDANVVLGRLNPEYLLGGELKLRAELAHRAIDEQIARPLGLSVPEAAAGIIRIVNEHMKKQIKLSLTRKGADPREFKLVAFGGAGPTHASAVARELEIRIVVVPPWPGMNSALGLLATPVKREYLLSRLALLDSVGGDGLAATYELLQRKALQEFQDEGFGAETLSFGYGLDLRYAGQAYELPLDFPSMPEEQAVVRREFDEAHERTFGHRSTEPVEVVTYRLACVAPVAGLEPGFFLGGKALPRGGGTPLKGRRRVYFWEEGRFVETPVYERWSLSPDAEIVGPAIIEQMDTTTVVEIGVRASLDGYGNLVLRVSHG